MVTFYFVSHVVLRALPLCARYDLLVGGYGTCANAESFWTIQTPVSENIG